MVENGVSPTRAYYCEVCMGWHVTHIEDGTRIEQNIESVKSQFEELDNWRKEQAKKYKIQLGKKREELASQYKKHNDSIYKECVELLERAKSQYQEGKIEESRETLKTAQTTSLDIKAFNGTNGKSFKHFKQLRREINELLTKYRY